MRKGIIYNEFGQIATEVLIDASIDMLAMYEWFTANGVTEAQWVNDVVVSGDMLYFHRGQK